MTFSLYSKVHSGMHNWANIYLNGEEVEAEHGTYSSSGVVSSTSGREVTLHVSEGDNIDLRTTVMDGHYYYINYCAEYSPKM